MNSRIAFIVGIVTISQVMAGSVMAEPYYVGNKACITCHKAEYEDWKRSPHAKAYELLLKGKRVSPKQKAGLEDKDFQKDGKCVKCHATGARKEGGFVDIESTPEMAGVGCESCHGPGSEYRHIHKKRPLDFKRSDARAAGAIYATLGDKEACDNCHSPDSPFKPSVNPKYAFDLKVKLKEGAASFHLLYPLEGKHD